MWRPAEAMARDAAPRTYEQLTQLASRDAVDHAIARGALVRLLPNQYCLAEHSESWTMRAHAAVAWAGPGAALSGQAALAVWNYAPLPIDVIDVVVPAGGHRTGPDWLRVRSLSAPYRTIVLEPAMAIVESEMALVLAYGRLPRDDRPSFVYGALQRNLVTAQRLQVLLNAVPRVRFRKELARRLELINAGAESYLEELAMADVLRGAGFEGLVFQHRFRVEGVGYRVDAFHPPSLTVFEFDGRDHDKPDQRARDVLRDARLAALGILTVRYTFKTIADRAQWCRANALSVIDSRTNQA